MWWQGNSEAEHRCAATLPPSHLWRQAMKFGAHMSISGGLHKAFGHGERAGCDTVQIFTKSQQQWRAKPLAEKDLELFRAEQQRTGFGPLVVHDSYLINLASPND